MSEFPITQVLNLQKQATTVWNGFVPPGNTASLRRKFYCQHSPCSKAAHENFKCSQSKYLRCDYYLLNQKQSSFSCEEEKCQTITTSELTRLRINYRIMSASYIKKNVGSHIAVQEAAYVPRSLHLHILSKEKETLRPSQISIEATIRERKNPETLNPPYN